MAILAMTMAAVWRTSKTDALRVERRLFFIWDRKDGSNASHCVARAFCNMNGKGRMVLGEREREKKAAPLVGKEERRSHMALGKDL